ncbi:MAG: exodeoxyribonuclease VII large subunit, partial [Acidobacteriaceae bacterium]
ELVTDAQYRVAEHLDTLMARLERASRYQRMRARERLSRLDAAAAFARLQHGLARRQQRLDELSFRIESCWERLCAAYGQRIHLLRARLIQQDVRRQLALHQEKLRALRIRLSHANRVAIDRSHTRWGRAHDRLLALSPLAVLDRGYALVYLDSGPSAGRLVKDAASLRAEDALRIRFAHGRANARVIETGKDLPDKP